MNHTQGPGDPPTLAQNGPEDLGHSHCWGIMTLKEHHWLLCVGTCQVPIQVCLDMFV